MGMLTTLYREALAEGRMQPEPDEGGPLPVWERPEDGPLWDDATLGDALLSAEPGGVPLLDVPGLIRRVRRRLDASQRDLAGVLGVSPGAVGRWESGSRTPPLALFERLLRLAGLRIMVLEDEAAPARESTVEGFGDVDSATDRAGRRFPAHLDVAVHHHAGFTTSDEPPAGAPRREVRDARRGRRPLAERHPTGEEVREALARAVEEVRARVRAARERVRAARVNEPEPICECPLECDESKWCVDDCPCACEPWDPGWAFAS